MSQTYKIGTRDSLLAMTQSGQVRDLLEEKTGHKFELVPLKTQGDLNTSVPLWQLEGENFFTKELDTALVDKKVDLVVHSYKDLGSKRPTPLTLAAISERFYANDILLIKKNTVNKMPHRIRVGTSSPRRVTNLQNSLSDYIPNNPQVECQTIRGNVNSRIKKLQEDQFDAIVLAHAGLERLAIDPKAVKELKPLLSGLQFMLLPQSVFPSAASQGALAIECLSERKDIVDLVQVIHHSDTAQEIERERKAFNEYGGGCHLAVGIRVQKFKNFFVHTHRGKTDRPVQVRFLEGRELPKMGQKKIFIGMNDPIIKKKTLRNSPSNQNSKVITSRYCLDWLEENYRGELLWTAGTATYKQAASRGFWISGSMDSLGEQILEEITKSKVIQILSGGEIKLSSLSHDKAESKFENVIACYTHEILPEEISSQSEVYYWSSFFQYQTYNQILGPFPSSTVHCCGVGKTYDRFQKEQIKVIPFSGIEEFKQWSQYE